jgi:hypothetical protein
LSIDDRVLLTSNASSHEEALIDNAISDCVLRHSGTELRDDSGLVLKQALREVLSDEEPGVSRVLIVWGDYAVLRLVQ